MSQLDPERRRVLAVLRRHGWNATSFQVLEPGFQYWFADEDACVACVDTGRAWVAAGAPLTEPARLREVAESAGASGPRLRPADRLPPPARRRTRFAG
jgi:phosphatidylglycerol lysyltransferase